MTFERLFNCPPTNENLHTTKGNTFIMFRAHFIISERITTFHAMIKKIGISIFFVLLLGLFAMKVSNMKYSDTGDRLYSKQDCIEDLNRISYEIKNTHPAPFDYISESDFDALLQTQINALEKENTLRDFHWIARKLIASIGCGHTSLNGQLEERNIADSLHFPIDTRFVGDQLFVIHDDDRFPSLPIGTEIKMINGQLSESILRSMIQRVSSDGLNEAYPRYYINREVDFFLESHFDIPHTYDLLLANNRTINISAGAAHKQSITHGIPQIENLELDIDLENDIAILTIRSFNYYGTNYNEFARFVDKSMDEVRAKDINNLIIDIRGNGGGDPNCANHLLRHITKKSFQYFHESNMGYADLKKQIQPYDVAYKGDTYMIIDGGCGSTSGHLSSVVKYNNIATLVGQTSGATYKCHDNSGDVTLPNTKLNLHIARMTFRTAVEGMNMSEGVIPDIKIEKSLSDWTDGGDSVIDSIYQIINR